MSTNRPWMPWYPKDIATDPKYICLPRSARLTYRELMDHCWMAGAKLPNDERKLAALAGLPLDQFRQDWELIQDSGDPCFITHPVFDGFLTNKRQLVEWNKAEEISEIARENGRKGGRPRNTKTTDKTKEKTSRVNSGLAKRNPEKSQSQSQSQSHTQSQEDNTPHSPPGGNVHEERFDQFWEAYPRKKSKGQARTTWKKIFKDTTPDKREQLFADIMRGVKQAMTFWAGEQRPPDKIPYPSTWLNAEGWLDEENPKLQRPPCNARNLEVAQKWLDANE